MTYVGWDGCEYEDLEWDNMRMRQMTRPTLESHCPACLENWYALGVADPCSHDRANDADSARLIDGGITDPPESRQ